MEDEKHLDIVRTSKPPKSSEDFKSSSMLLHTARPDKRSYSVGVQNGKLVMQTMGTSRLLSAASYIISDLEARKTYHWSSSSTELTNPGLILFERKNSSIRFALVTQDGTELTWEDPIVFMFIGFLHDHDDNDPCVVYAAGIGGPHGFGGLTVGKDPDLINCVRASYAALATALAQNHDDKPELQGGGAENVE